MTEATTLSELASENYRLKKESSEKDRRIALLTEELRVIRQTTINGMPDFILLESGRADEVIEGWNGTLTDA